MKVLAIRTDRPVAELYIYDGKTKLAELKWEAHRQLAASIHQKLEKLYIEAKLSEQDIEGIVIYKGPGSFTGLRIGFSFANTLANLWKTPILSAADDNWIVDGINRLESGENENIALPEYGGPAHTTSPKR